MTVVSVDLEANGWVLAVRGVWSETPGAWEFGAFDRPNARFMSSGTDQFPLDPDGTPKLVLSVQDAGWDRVGGLPSANANRPRTVIATKPLRKAFNADGDGSTSAEKIDEFNHGDGTRTIRFALSDRIYSDSTIVSATFGSGWKAGQGGGIINTVTNNSTRAAPLPLFKWANEPWPYVGGSVGSPVHLARVELLVATHHPEHDGSNLHQACAAVLLRAYDGTTTKDFYFTAPQTSPLYGDNLRCWGGEIDLTGLNPGPITVHATVYPWVGAPRSTGTAHNTDVQAALSPTWGSPFHLWYDPEGTVWPRKYIAIDPVGGTTTVADVRWQNSVAAANAAAAGTKPANFITACLAVANAAAGGAQTLPVRNGFASFTNCGAWWEVLLPSGVSEPTANLSGTPRSGPGYLVVRGNPDVSEPRANCILRSGSAQRTWNSLNRMKFRDLTLELGGNAMFNPTVSPTTTWATLENVNIRPKPSAASGFHVYTIGSNASMSHFNVDARNYNTQGVGWLFRNVTRTAAINSSSQVSTIINTKINLPEPGDFAPSRSSTGVFTSGTAANDDLMLWNVEVYGWEAGLVGARTAVFGQAGSQRWALVNVLFEHSPGTEEVLVIGETSPSELRDSIIENVTFVGGRWNWHNDVTLAGTSDGNAVRVNTGLNGGRTIRIGLMDHGMTTGDTINVSGFTGTNGANLNVTDAPVTVLDAHRFEYDAPVAVTSATNISGTGVVTYVTGAMSGQPARTILSPNLRHIGNAMRFCSHDRNGTKHDLFSSAGHLTGSWELLYGVGFRGNVHANRGTASWTQYQYAFFGLGADVMLDFSTADPISRGVNWHGYVDDNSKNGPDFPTQTNNGDYRADSATLAPYKPSRLLNKGTTPANTDRDGRGGTKGATFDAGALGRLGTVIVPQHVSPDSCASAQSAESGRLTWVGRLVVANALSAMIGGASALSLSDASPTFAKRVVRVEPEGNSIGVEAE